MREYPMSIIEKEIIIVIVGLVVMWVSGYLIYIKYRIFKKKNTRDKTVIIFFELLGELTLSNVGAFFGSLILVLILTLDIIRQLFSR
jgi:hypothetical protein